MRDRIVSASDGIPLYIEEVGRTVLESAALGAAYAILVEVTVFRDVHPTRDLPRVLVHASTLVGSVVILLGAALVVLVAAIVLGALWVSAGPSLLHLLRH